MADNFDLKKFLKESKAIENLNNIFKKENISEGNMRDKIRDMVIAELGGGEDYELEDRKMKYGMDPEREEEDYSDYFFDIDTPEEDLEEAKKKKDEKVEDVETTDTETTDTSSGRKEVLTKLDKIFARLDDMDTVKSENVQTEILMFIMTGLGVIFLMDISCRAASLLASRR
jgi:predicted KAP-like P-loop ATPase